MSTGFIGAECPPQPVLSGPRIAYIRPLAVRLASAVASRKSIVDEGEGFSFRLGASGSSVVISVGVGETQYSDVRG